ncbi:hypothetical protein QJS66_03810 [Kocuria rhizophila]|nr:hypothetical protein QJS66_03810 [Kocuria rhizophila]
MDNPYAERRSVVLDGYRVRCWTYDADERRKPLLVGVTACGDHHGLQLIATALREKYVVVRTCPAWPLRTLPAARALRGRVRAVHPGTSSPPDRRRRSRTPARAWCSRDTPSAHPGRALRRRAPLHGGAAGAHKPLSSPRWRIAEVPDQAHRLYYGAGSAVPAGWAPGCCPPTPWSRP